jgi:hypothetical protein
VNDEPPQGGFVVSGRPVCAARKIAEAKRIEPADARASGMPLQRERT